MPESHAVRLNRSAAELFDVGVQSHDRWRMQVRTTAGATIVDAGIDATGSMAAGLWLARLCMSNQCDVQLVAGDRNTIASDTAITVATDDPMAACLASQYAGWPVAHEKFFAMGSGPMRLSRGREPMLEQLGLIGTAESILGDLVGVLESEVVPDAAVIESIADQCDASPSHLRLAIAPSFSLAGTIQVVARSVETAMHKLHALDFDVAKIVSGFGHAPLPPIAKRGDTVGGIGRTNDAILYGGTVTFWTDAEDDAIAAVIEKVPSCGSSDHGRPFAEVFKSYDYDFYKVDPMLFSPAVVVMRSIISGNSFAAGGIDRETLQRSFT